MTDELWQKSACELAEGIARRQFSCGEVMASVAERIRAKNKALNAIVFDYTEEALAEARRADEDLAAGRQRGPLHGVPVTIKENVDQQGKPTPNGLPAFETVIAPDDAPVVANLRRAGRPGAPARRRRPASGPSTTAMTSAVRCGSPRSRTGCPR